MKAQNYLNLMDSINVIISFINKSLKEEGITCYRLQDLGEKIRFSINATSQNINIVEIANVEDALRLIYDSLAFVFPERINIGATSEFKNNKVTWNLAPVIDEKVMIEFMSPKEKDQEWFYSELDNSCKVKGHI